MKNRSFLIVASLALLVALVFIFKSPDTDSPASSAGSDLVDSQQGGGFSERQPSSGMSAGPVTLDEEFDASLYTTINHLDGPPSSPDRLFVRVPSTSSRLKLLSNSQNEFPVQPAGLEETVALRITLPDVKSGTPVAVVILDGGTFPSEKPPSKAVDVQKWGGIEFNFTTSANLGHHRIQVTPRGHSSKLLDIYAASDPLNAPL